MDNSDWFEKPEVASEASLKQINELCEKAFALKEKIAEIEAQASHWQGQLSELQGALKAQLDAAGLEEFRSAHGLVYTQSRTSYRVPQDDEARAKFFEYLKAKGQFDSMITVHSQTLNAYCKKELEEHQSQGDMSFKIPGIDEPIVSKDLRMRRK